jgi:hypothetical protein
LLLTGLATVGIAGCQTQFGGQQRGASSGRVKVTPLPSALTMAPVLVPDPPAASGWDVLTAQEAERLLDMPMPPVTDANRDQPVEQVIEALTGRRMLWVPPEPRPEPVSYGSESASTKGKSLGQYLRGLIGGSTTLGYPKLRMARTGPTTMGSAPFGVPPAVTEQPELMDVVIMTRKHVIIVAAPRQ